MISMRSGDTVEVSEINLSVFETMSAQTSKFFGGESLEWGVEGRMKHLRWWSVVLL